MPTAGRVAETLIYSLLNLLPYLILALYPFYNTLRFSRRATVAFVVALTLVQIGLGACAMLFFTEYAGLWSLLSTALYAAFFLLCVKDRFGKIVFMLLMVSNAGNMVVMLSKALENLLFPELAVQGYRWSFSLCTALVQAATFPLLFLYFRRYFCGALRVKSSEKAWRYLWLVPGTFYFCWYFMLYFNPLSSHELALMPENAVFTALLNLGAMLVYSLVAGALVQADRNVALQAENYTLSIENMQYRSLTARIEEARAARHDLRHHLSVLQTLLQRQDYEQLSRYLQEYLSASATDAPLSYCPQMALNAVTAYYAQIASQADTKFTAELNVPAELPLRDADLTVLFGNLLENACAASLTLPQEEREIVFRVEADGRKLRFTLDNRFSGELRTQENRLLSTKHEGFGLGVESARNIAQRCGGDLQYRAEGGWFRVSGLLHF